MGLCIYIYTHTYMYRERERESQAVSGGRVSIINIGLEDVVNVDGWLAKLE